MSLSNVLQALLNQPELIEFADVMALIDSYYDFTPTAFQNGDTNNEAGANNGSCKLFALAHLQGLSEAETLALFGQYYRDDVLKKPNGDDHQNIRNFMQYGWQGIHFSGEALTTK